ncbi:hypothetical protein CHLRE_04g223450v5 [Chlamydomonas reinhardtii]|uniref:Uncharacterized protein n=1 Tax=Chlamydomonas reinhardtii TaxID=3055 RepID=A0A2K3DUE1_CHLRE|nr:uncharacterized protein CHLRE_04g223450v5 [Chlamydomonas reinhardtii]PNW84156.1 hypothetical protein CHLRE_04g223450v5 [Chlamydomonas reinhardtii]
MQRRSHGHICSAAERASSSPVVTVTEKASAGTLAPHVTPPSSFAAASNGGPSTAAKDRSPISARQGNSAGGGAGGPGGGGEEEASDSYQIGLDAFSQQALLSALTAGAAAAIARVAGLDLGSCLRLDLEALGLALELSAPVLVLLLVVSVPRWAPPFKGTELERLRHNFYMTAQVLQLYLDDEDGDDDSESDLSAGPGGNAGAGGSSERARVRRRLKLEQTAGWPSISSGLALMQAFALQPWNPPTSNNVFAAALAGRSVWQLANEFLVRGTFWGLISGGVAAALSGADTSDGLLFYGKVFGGQEVITYVSGLALVALALPGALWEARNARNFVRASVVGPVRDAAIFCTGNGVDEPAYCDPAGFAMMAARRPGNAAFVADVVTRTRAWRSGPQSSFSSVSSLSSMDAVGGEEAAAAANAAAAATSSGGATAQSAAAADIAARQQAQAQLQAPSGSSSSNGNSVTVAAASSNSSSGHNLNDGYGSGTDSDDGDGSSSGSQQLLPGMGPTLKASSTEFEWDSEDMGVLLRVETLQDKLAFAAALYFQLLAAFAINGAFLASDGNLLASFAAAWLLRTGPLLLAEAHARTGGSAYATLPDYQGKKGGGR